MNEQQTMLSEMAGGIFADLGPGAAMEDAWPQIEALALPSLLLAENAGGFGGSWEDARIVARLAGHHAVSVPVVEAILARLAAGPDEREGRGTIASGSQGVFEGDCFSGTVTGAIASEGAAYIVAPVADGGAILLPTEGGKREERRTLEDATRDRWRFDNAPATRCDIDIFMLGAFARTAQIAGALDAALAISVDYVNERKQFGRPIAKFQAVQQSLATFACEAAAANCAAIGLAQALDRGQGAYEIAAAKLRANRAVGIGAAIAHQVHGAIGFTHEYSLHPFTRRLWSWRSEFGGDSYWAAELGRRVLASGADAFWSDLTALTD